MSSKPFQGIRTFCKTSNDQSARYTVIGIPTDSISTYRPGTRFGPSSIREASMMLSSSIHSTFVTDIKNYTADVGDVELNISKPTGILEEVETVTTNILSWEKHPVFLGGDHSITYGILKAMNKKYGRIALVNFDAHGDCGLNEFDNLTDHGNWLFKALSENLIDATKVISIGIRHPAHIIGKSHLLSYGGTIYTSRYAQQNMRDMVINIKNVIGNTPVFLSFDVDALDPAYAPGTGNPEVGGLTSSWVLECIESLWDLNWIGMDIVEVSPPYDHAEITSLLAATIVWTYLSMVIAKEISQSEIDPDTSDSFNLELGEDKIDTSSDLY